MEDLSYLCCCNSGRPFKDCHYYCPCGSDIPYEDCCYKKKDEKGKPLFFNDLFCGPPGGFPGHPMPNFNKELPLIILAGMAEDKYRVFARKLIEKSKLEKNNFDEFINVYGKFYKSYEMLLNVLKEPTGTTMAFKTDSLESRKQWYEFLHHGRVLIEFLGFQSKNTLQLKRVIGGLNKDRFDNLLIALEENGDEELLNRHKELIKIKQNILLFIDFRNEEKKTSRTILEFPIVNDKLGIINDGIVEVNNIKIGMIEFIEQSWLNINELVKILMNINI